MERRIIASCDPLADLKWLKKLALDHRELEKAAMQMAGSSEYTFSQCLEFLRAGFMLVEPKITGADIRSLGSIPVISETVEPRDRASRRKAERAAKKLKH